MWDTFDGDEMMTVKRCDDCDVSSKETELKLFENGLGLVLCEPCAEWRGRNWAEGRTDA